MGWEIIKCKVCVGLIKVLLHGYHILVVFCNNASDLTLILVSSFFDRVPCYCCAVSSCLFIGSHADGCREVGKIYTRLPNPRLLRPISWFPNCWIFIPDLQYLIHVLFSLEQDISKGLNFSEKGTSMHLNIETINKLLNLSCLFVHDCRLLLVFGF